MGKIWVPKINERQGQILIFFEKHGNRYFLAETKEQVYSACLKILKEREWYFNEPKEPELENVYESAVFEEGSPFDLLKKKITKENERKFAEYKEMLYEYKLVRIALDENRGDFAWAVISQRYDYEYERYEFEQLENV